MSKETLKHLRRRHEMVKSSVDDLLSDLLVTMPIRSVTLRLLDIIREYDQKVYEMEAEKARAIIAIRDALIKDNKDDAYYELLRYADPSFSIPHHWQQYEALLEQEKEKNTVKTNGKAG